MLPLIIFSLACDQSQNENNSENGKNVVITAPKHAAPKADDFKTKSFYCCKDSKVNTLLTAYLDFTRALAADKSTEGLTLAKKFLSLAEKQPELASESKELVHLWDSAEGVQDNLEGISKKFIAVAQENKAEKGTQIIVAFCPMKPGRWLQTEKIISNPYFGSKMLTCGVFE